MPRPCCHSWEWPTAVLWVAIMIAGFALSLPAQTVSFNAPFTAISQGSVTYGQGIVADANSNLYITGTVNLLYLARNTDGTYTPASSKIDSQGRHGVRLGHRFG